MAHSTFPRCLKPFLEIDRPAERFFGIGRHPVESFIKAIAQTAWKMKLASVEFARHRWLISIEFQHH